MITNLRSVMFEKGQKIIQIGDNLDNIIFIYSGKAHLYGKYDW